MALKILQTVASEIKEAKSRQENVILRKELKNLNQCLTDLIEQIKDFSMIFS